MSLRKLFGSFFSHVAVSCNIALAAIFLFYAPKIYCDTIYLKNGHKAEGLISSEDKESIDLDIGCGLVNFKQNEIVRIYRSTPDEAARIKKDWAHGKAQAQKTKAQIKEESKRASEKWSEIISQVEAQRLIEEEKRGIDASAKVVPVVVDESRHLVIEAMVNGKAHAFLVVDTGAPDITLTANMARKLGIDLGSIRCVSESMFLNGKHKVGRVILDSVKMGDLEEKNIAADVMLEDDKEIDKALKGGLLGLSFLNRFNITLDRKNSTLIFKKIPMLEENKKPKRPQ
jgi:clan AA aspartic protease (TIGR02281 family)